MTDGRFRAIRDDGTLGTVDPPPRVSVSASVCRHMTPQVRPVRPARPVLSFFSTKQEINRDASAGRRGTARLTLSAAHFAGARQ